MEPFVLQNDSIFELNSWIEHSPCLVAGFTTKHGGFSSDIFKSLNLGFHVGDALTDVSANRKQVASLIEFPLSKWVGAEQTHEVNILKITKKDCGKGSISYDNAFKRTDGFYTDEEGVLLTLCFADCVPLFFIAPEYKMIGVAHAGWKGSVGQIAKKMITEWEKEGIASHEIYAAIGPSICEKCYIVDQPVIDLVENTLEESQVLPYNLIKEGQYSLDLKKLNKQILLSAGVPSENISITGLCTSCNHDMFFSHRFDKGQTGRMLSFIGWKETRQ